MKMPGAGGGSWKCDKCGNKNIGFKKTCSICGSAKPAGGGAARPVKKMHSPKPPSKPKPAPKPPKPKPVESEWKATLDPASGDTYYWNTRTNEVTWDKPADMPLD
jgi:hypothetical protein